MAFDDFLNKYSPAEKKPDAKQRGVAPDAKYQIQTDVDTAFSPTEKQPEPPIWHGLRQILG